MKINQKLHITEPASQAISRIGESLRGHRLVNRLTQEQAAEQAGFSRQTLSRIERGDPSVAFGQVARYAEVVGADTFSSPLTMAACRPEQRRVRRSAQEKHSSL